MSVYKSRRREAAQQVLTEAKELRLTTITYVNRFPTSYRWVITNNLLQMASDIYSDCMRAVGVEITSDKHDYDLRHRYMEKVLANLTAFSAEISFCYDLIHRGNNFFDGKKDYNKAFFLWSKAVSETKRCAERLIELDTKAFEEFGNRKIQNIYPSPKDNSEKVYGARGRRTSNRRGRRKK